MIVAKSAWRETTVHYIYLSNDKIWQQWLPDALGFSVTKIEVVIILAMLNLQIAICDM